VLLIDVPFSIQEDDNVLHIGGIFPIGGKGGWQGGQACEPAVRLALEDVNKNSILSGYQLKLHWNDSEVSLPTKYFILGSFTPVVINKINNIYDFSNVHLL